MVLKRTVKNSTFRTVRSVRRQETEEEDRSAIKPPRQIHPLLLADKGNATVAMDRVEYDHKVIDRLNSGSYRELRRDPTAAIERKLQQKLLSLHRSGNITEQLYRQLHPSNSRCPRFFGQPKIHKKETPLRPIVASRGGPTYNTARHLAKIPCPLVGNTSITSRIQMNSRPSSKISGCSQATSWSALMSSRSSPVSHL